MGHFPLDQVSLRSGSSSQGWIPWISSIHRAVYPSPLALTPQKKNPLLKPERLQLGISGLVATWASRSLFSQRKRGKSGLWFCPLPFPWDRQWTFYTFPITSATCDLANMLSWLLGSGAARGAHSWSLLGREQSEVLNCGSELSGGFTHCPCLSLPGPWEAPGRGFYF